LIRSTWGIAGWRQAACEEGGLDRLFFSFRRHNSPFKPDTTPAAGRSERLRFAALALAGKKNHYEMTAGANAPYFYSIDSRTGLPRFPQAKLFYSGPNASRSKNAGRFRPPGAGGVPVEGRFVAAGMKNSRSSPASLAGCLRHQADAPGGPDQTTAEQPDFLFRFQSWGNG